MDDVWKELIRAVPWGAVIIILRLIDMKYQSEQQRERDNNAKEKAIADRETQVIVGKAYADAINNLAGVLADFKSTILQQYENIGITQDLIKIAKERFQGETKRK